MASWALENTTPHGDGNGAMGASLPTIDLGAGLFAKKVSAGDNITCVILNTDRAKCWGRSDYGETGQETSYNIGNQASEMGDFLNPIDFGSDNGTPWKVTDLSAGVHSCALFTNGKIKCWGRNAEAQTGHGTATGNDLYIGDQFNEMGDNLEFLNLGTGRTVLSVSVGSYRTCAHLDNNKVKCWGQPNAHQLGNENYYIGDAPGETPDNLTPTDFGSAVSIKEIFSGRYHACALFVDGRAKCWGDGNYGKLLTGSKSDKGDVAGEVGEAQSFINISSTETIVDMDLGLHHTCAILSSGKVKCWGYGVFGSLGLGDSADRGHNSSTLGDLLDYVDLGTGRTAKKIASATYNSCAILDNDSVKCWGYNANGALGHDDTVNRGNGGVGGEMGDLLLPIELGVGRTAKEIAGGNYFWCAILDDNSIKCWGIGTNGRLGNGDGLTIGNQAGEMAAIQPVDVGNDALGNTLKAVQLSAGSSYMCALFSNEKVKCWGYNSYGSLGIGSVAHKGSSPTHMGDNLPFVDIGFGRSVVRLSVGDGTTEHNCAILDDASVKCWGRNDFGQLGLGNNDHYGITPETLGDALPTLALPSN